MGLFSQSDMAKIKETALKSKQILDEPTPVKSKSINTELNQISQNVIDYFKDSQAILITTPEGLHAYVDDMIAAGIGSVDVETTGLDRLHDTVVGTSLYFPGGIECYIPNKHLVPIFNEPYKNQLTYEQVNIEYQRMADAGVKLVFANADFDLAMIYKDIKVDFCKNFLYDCILAWRCIKENEKDNRLKTLYNKYVLNGQGDPKHFSDFFPHAIFPYSKPEVARLYAANDPKLTFELYLWQIDYIAKDESLQYISKLIWDVEFKLVEVCQNLHRQGVYIDQFVAKQLNKKYIPLFNEEIVKLQKMVQDVMDNPRYASKVKRPFNTSSDFNPKSEKHVSYLCYEQLKLNDGKSIGTDKDVLKAYNLPITNQILYCRSLGVLISTFVEKLPKEVIEDGNIHCVFKQIGADTGRFSSAEPNLQNIPSKVKDIRHMFRAKPGYVFMSVDYSQQEPKLTAYVSQDEKMISAFKEGKDIYATIASMAFVVPYEQCLENDINGNFSPEGNARRQSAKTIVLGICYGRSVVTIAEQLYGEDDSLSDKQKIDKAQKVYDAVLAAFPALRSLMINAQAQATQLGYVETILGRRRHIPEMQLPKFEFKAMTGYSNPDIDPMDISTLDNVEDIPQRIIEQFTHEFNQLKYYGQIVKKTNELRDMKIKVINNQFKLNEASRQVVNSIIQGSAAEQTKLAMLLIHNDEEWNRLGGRMLICVHDELIAEAPMETYQAAADRLNYLMCKAADFLPFESKCDVTITYRWYGLAYPCKYKKPDSLDILSTEEQCWVQYHLFEMGYPLVDKPNKKLKGDMALGVDGNLKPNELDFINEYILEFRITRNEFIDHISKYVHEGVCV